MNSFFKSKFQEITFLGVILLSFIAFYIETDIYTPSFPEMVAFFGTNEDAIQLILSMNFLGLCLSSLFFGPASDAYGRKTILCLGLSIFMLGSIGCTITDTLSWMVLYRFLQGIGCGAIVGAGISMVFDVYPADKSSRLVSICNGTIGAMMAVAPMLGNWISLHMGWRANFYLIAALAILSFFCTLTFTRETLPREKRIKLSLPLVCKNYAALLTNFPFMAHTLIWCLTFSIIIVFIANLSLVFVDYLQVPKEIFGYYQAAIMGAFFVGSMAGAYVIKKLGMLSTKVIGSIIYLLGIFSFAFLSYLNMNSPLLLIVFMSLASLGNAVAMTIYFTYSMSHVEESLRGSAMALSQCLRLFLSSGLVWLAARGFDGSTKPMCVIAIASTIMCIVFYVVLYKKNLHLQAAAD